MPRDRLEFIGGRGLVAQLPHINTFSHARKLCAKIGSSGAGLSGVVVVVVGARAAGGECEVLQQLLGCEAALEREDVR